MPNGDPDWGVKERPKLEKFFSKISTVLEDFADLHNLLITKYYHQFSSWDLIFRHPKEGIAKIEVRKESDNKVRICPVWWIDESKTKKTRHLFSSKGEVSSLDADKVREILEAALTSIVSWDKSILIRKGELSPSITRGIIKKELEKYKFPKHIKIIDNNEKDKHRFL